MVNAGVEKLPTERYFGRAELWAVGFFVPLDVQQVAYKDIRSVSCIIRMITACSPVRLPFRRESGQGEPLCELRFPRQPPNCLCIINPLPSSLLALQPFSIEVGHVELVEVVRRRCRRDRSHETRNFAAYAGCMREGGRPAFTRVQRVGRWEWERADTRWTGVAVVVGAERSKANGQDWGR